MVSAKPPLGKQLMRCYRSNIIWQKVMAHKGPPPGYMRGQTHPCGNHEQSRRNLAGKGQATRGKRGAVNQLLWLLEQNTIVLVA